MGNMLPVAHHLSSLGVIIVAAGRGERLGAKVPKAFVELNGTSLLEHCVRTVTGLEHGGQLVLVVPAGEASLALDIAESSASDRWQVSVVAGGRERHESTRNGLEALKDSVRTVLVHDAARPLTPAAVFERVIASLHEYGTAIVPALPVVDTLKRVSAEQEVISTEDRRPLVRAQTPQGFDREQLEAAHRSAAMHDVQSADDAPTDDAEVVQRFGGAVRWVEGSERSLKITTPDDLLLLEGLHAALKEKS